MPSHGIGWIGSWSRFTKWPQSPVPRSRAPNAPPGAWPSARPLSRPSSAALRAVLRRQPWLACPTQVDFNFHVRPILSDKCFKCHGPDDRARKGGLSLHTRDGAFATLATGHRAVVPGNTGKSELVRRILSTDPAVMMPMPDSHLELTDVEKATLVRWIEQGATWTPHWAFLPPKKAPVPTGSDLGTVDQPDRRLHPRRPARHRSARPRPRPRARR